MIPALRRHQPLTKIWSLQDKAEAFKACMQVDGVSRKSLASYVEALDLARCFDQFCIPRTANTVLTYCLYSCTSRCVVVHLRQSMTPSSCINVAQVADQLQAVPLAASKASKYRSPWPTDCILAYRQNASRNTLCQPVRCQPSSLLITHSLRHGSAPRKHLAQRLKKRLSLT